ncbi:MULTISPECIES: IS3 family transposase [unclassified Frankia]|uniref:IS3 family transposase n=1 Tax=unclassified Frankia TaxID=2632575 RepID=UPI001F10960F|nr:MULTISPECIES: IS3 family transposase [unclassified Frankia]
MAGVVGVKKACELTGRSRATFYRRHRPPASVPPRPVPKPHRERVQPRALSARERERVLEVLNSERFRDASPAHVWATLLDEGGYLASWRTFYRILAAAGQTGERRAQASHPSHVKPELLVCAPNQVWTWDITKLKGRSKHEYYYLYVILDVYSRYVVGWLLAPNESGELAKELVSQTCEKYGVDTSGLTVHADRGSSMTSKTLALLLADLDIVRSHSRPRVSNDNPFSESQCKTLKYRPEFPDRFDSIEQARRFCRGFFTWYNTAHKHSGIGYLSPAAVYFGLAGQAHAARARVLDAAYAAHPERFVNRRPVPPPLPKPAGINTKPDDQAEPVTDGAPERSEVIPRQRSKQGSNAG